MKATITTMLFFVCGCVFLSAGEPANDLEKFQGKWVVVKLTEQGKGIPSEETDLLELTIDKDVFTVTEKSQKKDEPSKIVVQYKIALDSSKTPKEINFTHLIDVNKGKTELGIYQFDKDQLNLCVDETRKGRPTVFEGKESEKYSVILLKKKA